MSTATLTRMYLLKATLAADTTYFFVVDGFNGAYGVWQFSLAALDNSSVEGSLLSGFYGLAVAGTSTINTTSKNPPVAVTSTINTTSKNPHVTCRVQQRC